MTDWSADDRRTRLSRRRLLHLLPAAATAVLLACRDGRSTDVAGSAPTDPPGSAGSGGSGPGQPAGSAPATAPGWASGAGGSATANGAAVVTPVPTPDGAGIDADPFRLGVASGDPLPDAVILWTRLNCDPTALDGGLRALAGRDVTVAWDLALDARFEQVIASGEAVAAAADGYSVHVDATGLPADGWFHYRFRVGRWVSRTGRTRTAPPADSRPERLVVAVASCQHYELGTYVAHRHLAAEEADLVLFLGDFIYEGPGGAENRVRAHPAAEATDLDTYRLRYAWYRQDPDLQAAQAAAPWAVIRDDHEVANNYAADRPAGGSPSAAFAARRTAAYQAWWENQPVRLARPGGADYAVNRQLVWGRLVRLLLLDGRSHRSPQACEGKVGGACPQLFDEPRTMLGSAQETWLTERFASSTVDGVTWTVLGNQTALTDLTFPVAAVPSTLYDQWDGYPAARRRLLTAARTAGVRNLVALTGDLHCALAADLELGSQVVGSEIVACSISSPFAANRGDLFELALSLLDHVRAVDTSARGYARVEFTPSEARCSFRKVADVRDPASSVRTTSTWKLTDGRPGLRAG